MVKTKIPPNDFLKIAVEIGAQRFEEDLAVTALIEPNIDALNEGLSKNPGLFAKWAMLEACARAVNDAATGAIATLDADLKDLEGKLFIKWSTRLPGSSEGRGPTLDSIKSAVSQDPERLTLVERRRQLTVEAQEAKSSLDYITVGRKTIEQRRDSLLELSRNWRAEMERGLSVAQRKAVDQFRPGSPVRPKGR